MKKHLLSNRAVILAVSSFTLLLFSSPISAHAATTAPAVPTEAAVVDATGSFESVSQLPVASFENDLIPGTAAYTQTVLARSAAYPTSIAGYKKLGYKNFYYSKWTGYKKLASTKSKRIAAFMVEQLAAKIPGARIPLLIYDLSQLAKTQHADIWPSVNARMISATSPRGVRVLVAEESYTRYYTNSARTKLLKTIHHTSFVG
ncbi:hypothetical protein ACFQ41_00350 [Lacticaseibacillus suilingensis]|uniref:Uncharacterized protein n=1 Tax=Lacticaseibacillus suilingensis TaxID=2799577 RepID=A0ABW4BB63_9LACO|nr:hypothetical protein [Lacticaseibacillus suilingensis]